MWAISPVISRSGKAGDRPVIVSPTAMRRASNSKAVALLDGGAGLGFERVEDAADRGRGEVEGVGVVLKPGDLGVEAASVGV